MAKKYGEKYLDIFWNYWKFHSDYKTLKENSKVNVDINYHFLLAYWIFSKNKYGKQYQNTNYSELQWKKLSQW